MRTLNELRVIQLEARQKKERERLSKVAPEMLDMLKALRREIDDTIIGKTAGWNKKIDELISKAEEK